MDKELQEARRKYNEEQENPYYRKDFVNKAARASALTQALHALRKEDLNNINDLILLEISLLFLEEFENRHKMPEDFYQSKRDPKERKVKKEFSVSTWEYKGECYNRYSLISQLKMLNNALKSDEGIELIEKSEDFFVDVSSYCPTIVGYAIETDEEYEKRQVANEKRKKTMRANRKAKKEAKKKREIAALEAKLARLKGEGNESK